RLARLAVPGHDRFSLVGDADRRDRPGPEPRFLQGRPRAADLRTPDFLGVVLDPAGLREILAEFLLRDRARPAALVEHDGTGAGPALVEGKHVAHRKIIIGASKGGSHGRNPEGGRSALPAPCTSPA